MESQNTVLDVVTCLPILVERMYIPAMNPVGLARALKVSVGEWMARSSCEIPRQPDDSMLTDGPSELQGRTLALVA